jgi:3-dehydroquinate synthetase
LTTAPGQAQTPTPIPHARVPVRTGGHAYDVVIGRVLASLPDLLLERGLIRPRSDGQRLFIGHDAGLPAVIVYELVRILSGRGLRITLAPVLAEETRKTIGGIEPLLAAIARSRHERTEPIIALGGGIVGDVVGFAAAIYRRGVPVIQIPTTLLAMVDASIGGKTAVNLDVDGRLMKNLIGAFHQPSLVISDVSLLSHLPARQLQSGLAECIKHGMIGAEFGEPDLLEWLEKNAAGLLARDPEVLTQLIARNVALKAAVIAQDEREEAADGGRALLNLGHTFGHAIETIPEARPEGAAEPGLHHGEAVGLGLIAAAHCACDAGLIGRDHDWPRRITAIVRTCLLPVRASHLPPPEEILARMAHDKKVKGGALRLVLPTDPSRCGLFVDPPVAAITAAIRAISAPS